MKYTLIVCCWLLSINAYSQAPVITDFNPKMGESGGTVILSGSGFDLTSANNVVHFGSVRATVLSASTTSLEVEIPSGIKADKINVLNTTTNLNVQTASNFYPTFNGGARIIPASFLPHQDLTLLNAARTVRLADIDGDGWLDIVAASSQEFSVYRNLGNGGKLSSTSFGSRIDLDPGAGFLDFGFADLDNDGKQDLYFSQDTNPDGKVGIYLNTSTPGNISFASEILLNASQRISYVAAGDFDGDGRQEIVAGRAATAGGTPAYLFIYQNLSSPGSLSFSAQIDITAAAPAGTWERMIVTDIDGDNKLDLAAQRNFKVRASVLLNQSTLGVIDVNTFATNTDFINGSSTIALSDFDGDDLPELITHNEANNTGIALRPNNSSAGIINFADSIPYFSNIFREGETAISDINGDGKKDIVIAADWSQNWVSILENNFNGTWQANSFKQPVRFTTNSIYPETLDIGDLNHDGKPDIVTANQTAFLSILENSVQFPPQITNVSTYQAQVGESITIEGQYFSITPSENKVRFGSVLANVTSATSTVLEVEVPQGAAYDHINLGRGIFSARSPRKFSVLSGPGANFDASSFAPPFSITATGDVLDLVVGDLDNDGKIDLLARDGSNPLILKNQSIFNELNASSFQIIPSGLTHFVTPGILTDLNGDNFLDLFGTSRVLLNNSESGTEPIEFLAQTTLAILGGTSRIVDVNLDGILDHVVTPNSGNVVTINEGFFTNAPFISNCCMPNSAFGPNINLTKPTAVGTSSIADFDGDGLPDIAASNPGADNVSFFRNLGFEDVISTTDFTTAENFSVGDNPTQIVSGDLDLDGKIDLVVINQNDNTVSVLHNQSTIGNFNFDLYSYSVTASPRLLRVHDLDGDSKPEIITMNAWISAVGPTFSILKNNTASMDASSFAVEQLYTRANNALPSDFEITDLDDDGRADLIFTSTNPDELIIYKNLVPNMATIAITLQPADQSLCEGENISFSVTANGTTNLTYQWQEDQGSGFSDLADGNGISGSATSTLSLTGVTNAQNGFFYRCVISGDFASDMVSNSASVSISPIPDDPTTTDGTGCIDTNITLTASGSTNGNYRWYDVPTGGSPITGEVNGTLDTSTLTSTTSYFVSIIENGCESNRVEVVANVLQPAAISNQPQNQTVNQGEAVSFAIVATGDNLTYQWHKDGSPLNNESNANLSINSATISDQGLYACEVENSCNSILSNEASLTVNDPNSGFSVTVGNQTQPINNAQQTAIAFEPAVTGAAASRTFIINNTGQTTITVSNILLMGDNVFTLGTIPSEVEVGGSVSFEVMAESQVSGLFTAAVRIETNIGNFIFPISVEFSDQPQNGSLIVYNAVAPNGNGKHDFLKIENIELFANSSVQIFNRWGDKVYEAIGYDNQSVRFEGVGNVGASKELVEGTYFYVIKTEAEQLMGYLFLRR